jgi:hypothetical protein
MFWNALILCRYAYGPPLLPNITFQLLPPTFAISKLTLPTSLGRGSCGLRYGQIQFPSFLFPPSDTLSGPRPLLMTSGAGYNPE